jgi:hypothetical protein
MSTFCDNVVQYIAGFVVKSVQKKQLCSECATALTMPTKELNTSDKRLIDIKNCGGLVHPSNDVVKVCKVTETIFRSRMAPGEKPVYAVNLQSALTTWTLHNLINMNLFSDLSEHFLTCDPLTDHRNKLLVDIIHQYLLIRLHHEAKTYTNTVQGEKVRSFLTKTVTFKGQ